MTVTVILILVIITATGFDFTNGFHDTGNAMATSIATKALSPKTSVTISAILNLVGAFLSIKVATGITENILVLQNKDGTLLPNLHSEEALAIIFAGLVGGIVWNLITWILGLPSSSSHALFGGLIGAGLVSAIVSPNWQGIITKVIVPAIFSPLIAGIVSATGTFLVYRITCKTNQDTKNRGFKLGQICTASLVSLAHGTGDAQKTMGVITLALIAAGELDPHSVYSGAIPPWIILLCAVAIALGTYLGGWRVIRTLGKGLVEIEPAQGLAAEAASAAIILTSSANGLPLSTTHVATGSILGSGVGKPGAQVRWNVAARMLIAWLITLPAAAVVGALAVGITKIFPGIYGSILIFIIMLILAGSMLYYSHKNKIDASNVNADWIDGTIGLGEREITAHISEPEVSKAS